MMLILNNGRIPAENLIDSFEGVYESSGGDGVGTAAAMANGNKVDGRGNTYGTVVISFLTFVK